MFLFQSVLIVTNSRVYAAASVESFDYRSNLSEEPRLWGLRRYVYKSIVFFSPFVRETNAGVFDGDTLYMCEGYLPFHPESIGPERYDSIRGQKYDVISPREIW